MGSMSLAEVEVSSEMESASKLDVVCTSCTASALILDDVAHSSTAIVVVRARTW